MSETSEPRERDQAGATDPVASWLRASDPAARAGLQDPSLAQARVARIVTAWRREQRGRAAGCWWASPGFVRVAGALALLAGIAGGVAVPRWQLATERTLDPVLWRAPPPPPSLTQLYLGEAADTATELDLLDAPGNDFHDSDVGEPSAPLAGEGRG